MKPSDFSVVMTWLNAARFVGVLVDHRAVLLAGLELAHDLPVGDLVGVDRAEHDGRVQQHRVDPPGAKGSERIDRAESH